MAEEEGVQPGIDQPGNGGDEPHISLVLQYVKDLSTENPNAPEVYQWTAQPQIDVQVNISANSGETGHEVALKLAVKALHDDKVAFHVELVYCGLFSVRGVPGEQLHGFMYAEAPRLLFPFARRILADAVRDAGFPPLMLDPIDFQALYQHQLAQGQIPPAGQA